MESKGDMKKKEVLKRWNELLNAQPHALINSARNPLPLSPFICFCLSEQLYIKEELHRENPGLSLTEISECIARTWALLSPQAKLPYEEMATKSMDSMVDGIAAGKPSGNENKKRPHFNIARLQQENAESSSNCEDKMDDRKIQGKKNCTLKDKNFSPLFSIMKDQNPQLKREDCRSKIRLAVMLANNESQVFNIECPYTKRIADNSCADQQDKVAEKITLKPIFEQQTVAAASDVVSIPPSHSSKRKDSLVGFRVFVQQLHPLVLKEYNFLSAEEVMKVLKSVWSVMPDVEREYYTKAEKEEGTFQEAGKHPLGKI